MSSYGRGHQAVTIPGLWLTVFTATLAAVLVGGLILGLVARAYIHWSIANAFEKMGETINKPRETKPVETRDTKPVENRDAKPSK